MECAVFALLGVAVGTLMTLLAKMDFAHIMRLRPHKGRAETVEKILPGEAKTQEALMQQWENLLRYSGGAGGEE